MGQGRRVSYSSSSSDEDSNYVPVRLARSRSRHHHSRHRERRHDSPPENIIINNTLRVPNDGNRGRAQSVGGSPVLLMPQVVARSPSRHSRHSSSSSSHTGRSHSRHSRHSHVISMDDLPYDMQRDLEDMRRYRESQRRDHSAERIRQALKDEQREERSHRERIELDLADKQRREKDAREAAVRDAEAAAAKEESRRERLIEEYKVEEARKKKEKDELAKRIILEKELKEKEEEQERKALKEKYLREAQEEERKKKDQEREKEEWFNEKLRRLAIEKGVPTRYAEELLRTKDSRHHVLTEGPAQPTWIRINRRHVLPETLDHFGLPWTYSDDEPDMIIIKDYIDTEFSRELFEHTQMIRKRQRITVGGSGYEKVTTLKPYEEKVVRKRDKMYLVRSKSKSPASRRLSFHV